MNERLEAEVKQLQEQQAHGADSDDRKDELRQLIAQNTAIQKSLTGMSVFLWGLTYLKRLLGLIANWPDFVVLQVWLFFCVFTIFSYFKEKLL